MNYHPKALFLSHGGGPLPLLGDPDHREMVVCLKDMAARIQKPKAVVVISAHWEETIPSITAGARPALIYDYYGFPEESYHIQYPCPGSPAIANKIHQLLGAANIDSRLDEQRGFDHGVFIPLKIMFPEADIPCVQLSLCTHLNPAFHIQMGQALRKLTHENILIVGSGFTFHNMKAFFQPNTRECRLSNLAFESWLIHTCCNAEMTEEQRKHSLIDWENAEGARYCHPREEHLLPLHLCYGVAESVSREFFALEILGKKASMYWW